MMFGRILRRIGLTKPPLDADKIGAQRCYRCAEAYEPWDGKVHPSLWRRDFEHGRIHGQIVRYCPSCCVGAVYPITEQGLADEPWEITLDDAPPRNTLHEVVTEDHVREQLRPISETSSRFALEVRIFFDTLQAGDTIRYFCSPWEDWQHLAGRRGYAIVRGESIVGAIVTWQN